MQMVSLDTKFRAFIFDWKLSWKYFEKYLKQVEKVREEKGISCKREDIIAFVRWSLNNHKLRFITKSAIPQVQKILYDSAGNNPFFSKAADYFVRFLERYLE